MATTKKRKVSKKAKTTKSEAGPLDPDFAKRASAVLADLEKLSEDYAAYVAAADPDVPLTQEVIVAAAYFSKMDTPIKALKARAKLSVKKWRGFGGFSKVIALGHAMGIVTFTKQDGSRVPKWKDIAIEKAGALALLENTPFDDDVYAEEVLEGTEAGKPSEKVTFSFAE